MLFWSHASSVGGTRDVLRTRTIQGAKLSGYQQHGDEESARIMSSNWTMSFNQAQLPICGRAVEKRNPAQSVVDADAAGL